MQAIETCTKRIQSVMPQESVAYSNEWGNRKSDWRRKGGSIPVT